MKKICLLALFIVICFSCEMVVDVDVPIPAQKITINATFTRDSTFQVWVNKSKYILDNGEHLPIENATVIIKENGIELDRLQMVESGVYKSISEKKPETGKQYEVEVSAAGMETVSASSFLPDSTIIRKVDFQFRESQNSDFNFVLDVSFQDDGSQENFYEVILIQTGWYLSYPDQDTMYYSVPVHIFSDDPNYNQEGLNSILFDDNLFNGKEITVPVKGYLYFHNSIGVQVVVMTLSKDLYQYKLTAALQNNSSGDPFAQPVHVHNNIQNGFGIFAGYNRTVVNIPR